jgi:hypothetical protein
MGLSRIHVIDGFYDRLISASDNIITRPSYQGISIDPATGLIYVIDRGSNVAYVVDGNSNSLPIRVPISFDTIPFNGGRIYCNNVAAAGRRGFIYNSMVNCSTMADKGFVFDSWKIYNGSSTSNSTNSAISFADSNYGINVDAKFVTFVQKYGSIISGLTVISILIATTAFTAIPSISNAIVRSPFFRNVKHLPVLVVLEKNDLMQIDATVIAGVLILLSLQRISVSSITEITANIVFLFAISGIMALINYDKFASRLLIAGFLNLIVSIILLLIIK